MSVTVLIPAYNEGSRISAVVDAVRAAGYGDVLVIDDGSKDDTAERARIAGARVLSLRPNRGKGGAMLAGLQETRGEVVLFLDGDLAGFSKRTLRAMTDPVERGEYDQVIGVSEEATPVTSGREDDASWEGKVILSGQRALRREYLLKLPEHAWAGYGIEVWINDVVDRFGGRTAIFRLPGVVATYKWEKEGAAKGLAKMADMGAEVLKAMSRVVAYYESKPMNDAFAGPIDNAAPVQYQKAPQSQTLEAQCSSTECVADALTASVRRSLWTEDVQDRFSNRISSELSRPVWIASGSLAYFLAGPAGAVVAGAAWLSTVGELVPGRRAAAGAR